MSPSEDNPPVRVPDPDRVPPLDKRKATLAGVLLTVPIVALMAVPSYNQEDPELLGFPFFFLYQFLWVFLCSGMTWLAYKLILTARDRHGADR